EVRQVTAELAVTAHGNDTTLDVDGSLEGVWRRRGEHQGTVALFEDVVVTRNDAGEGQALDDIRRGRGRHGEGLVGSQRDRSGDLQAIAAGAWTSAGRIGN